MFKCPSLSVPPPGSGIIFARTLGALQRPNSGLPGNLPIIRYVTRPLFLPGYALIECHSDSARARTSPRKMDQAASISLVPLDSLVSPCDTSLPYGATGSPRASTPSTEEPAYRKARWTAAGATPSPTSDRATDDRMSLGTLSIIQFVSTAKSRSHDYFRAKRIDPTPWITVTPPPCHSGRPNRFFSDCAHRRC